MIGSLTPLKLIDAMRDSDPYMLVFKKINEFTQEIHLGIFYVGGLVVKNGDTKWSSFISVPSKLTNAHRREIKAKLNELNANKTDEVVNE